MKNSIKILLVLVFVSLFFGKEAWAQNSLQTQINAAPVGGVVKLKAGTYSERIVINKPVVVEAEEVIIHNCSSKPAITITGKRVTLRGIKLVDCLSGKNSAAISISGSGHQLNNISVTSEKIALKLKNVQKSKFENIRIHGQHKENGIDLWQSEQNLFQQCEIKNVQDGIYLENSNHNTLIKNSIEHSRYGVHVMFSDHITLKQNTSTKNVTGAMIMGVKYAEIKENQLIDNQQNVNAQGLLLYDVHHSNIRDNTISHNRLGMYIEDSSSNTIIQNKVEANFIGTQMKKMTKTIMEENAFITNVNVIQATSSRENQIRHNYWDGALTLDTDGNHKSNIAFKADPYFLTLTSETPPYQLFFQHPGLVLLQKMLKSPEEMLVTDQEPLMTSDWQKNVQVKSEKRSVLLLSLLLITGSLFLLYIGRKKI